MSVTYDLVCVPCRKRCWIGQGYGKFFYTYGYVDENKQRHVDRFLSEHSGTDHSLLFLSDCVWDDRYEDFDRVEYEEHRLDSAPATSTPARA